MIARELFHRFPKTFRYISKNSETKPPNLLDLECFKKFIYSDYFFRANLGSPHPYGIGTGYENISKFFFWAKDVGFDLTSDPELKFLLYSEFAIYLVQMIPHASDPYFNQFKSGITFELADGSTVAVSTNENVRRIKKNVLSLLKDKEFFDLDQLVPGLLNQQTKTKEKANEQ